MEENEHFAEIVRVRGAMGALKVRADSRSVRFCCVGITHRVADVTLGAS